MSAYPQKKYPNVGVCGLDCGLCSRHHTQGTSRCPGCCGPDFSQKHPSCGFITCCVKEKGLETCAECSEQRNCARVSKLLESAKNHDSFISYRPVPGNFAFIRRHGIEAFARQETEKEAFLTGLIEQYDDGRSRSFFCTACQLLPFDQLKQMLARTEPKIGSSISIKDRAKVVREAIAALAGELGVDLRLRK